MLQQIATACRSPSFLDSFDEAGLIFQHPINRFFDHLRSIFAAARRNLPQASFLFG